MASSMSALAFSSSISSLRETIVVVGRLGSRRMSSAARRPMMRSISGSMISLPAANVADGDAAGGAAIFLADDHVLRNVDQTPREIARVGRTQRGVGQTLARAVRRDEVLENREAFFERSLDRNLENPARRVGHQSAHAAELLDLRDRTARTRGRHHEDRVERVLRRLHRGRDFVGGLRPDVDRLVVLLVLRDEALLVETMQLVDFILRLADDVVLTLRHDDVADRNRRTRQRGVVEAELLDRRRGSAPFRRCRSGGSNP